MTHLFSSLVPFERRLDMYRSQSAELDLGGRNSFRTSFMHFEDPASFSSFVELSTVEHSFR